MPEYGLPDARDSDGNIKEVDHTFEWDGEEVTIRLKPPTVAELQEYEELGEEANTSDLEEVLEDHLVKPELNGDLMANELLCYVRGIVDYTSGSGNALVQGAREELEERQGEEGN